MQVQAKVPGLLYDQWQPDGNGLVIVMEDLRARAGLQAASTRLTCQALGLNSAQVLLEEHPAHALLPMRSPPVSRRYSHIKCRASPAALYRSASGNRV